jgi:hypothetical protein
MTRWNKPSRSLLSAIFVLEGGLALAGGGTAVRIKILLREHPSHHAVAVGLSPGPDSDFKIKRDQRYCTRPFAGHTWR